MLAGAIISRFEKIMKNLETYKQTKQISDKKTLIKNIARSYMQMEGDSSALRLSKDLDMNKVDKLTESKLNLDDPKTQKWVNELEQMFPKLNKDAMDKPNAKRPSAK